MGLMNPQMDEIANKKAIKLCIFKCSIFVAYLDKYFYYHFYTKTYVLVLLEGSWQGILMNTNVPCDIF